VSLKGKRVLVTGAGGFMGSHLTERLIREGADVRAFVHYNALGSWGWLDFSPFREEIEVVAGDITDHASVRNALAGREIAFHLAALIAIPYSYQAPELYMRTNALGTLNILQAAREAGLERIIHTSTSEVYGTARTVPIPEEHPLQGQSPYSASKISADKVAESYACSFDTPVVTVRPFNTFGPRQSTRAVIPTIITQCLRGDVIKLGALSPTRDMNYVSNTIEGYLRAAEVPEAIGRTINLGSGREISIGDLAQMIAKMVGREVRIESQEELLRPDKSEVNRLLADNALALEILDWEPRVSLEEGLEKTIAWMHDHVDRYKLNIY
jgi:dTDP-glucose 4,6-dehydratase